MYKFRQVLRITLYNFEGWKRSPRVILTFILAFVLCLMLSDKTVSFAKDYGTIVQILEPFIWTFGDAGSVMLSSFLLILLFADMPFVTQATPYYLLRIKRSIWIYGQILYVVLGTLIYMFFLLVVECLLAAPISFVGNIWSETAAMIGYSGIGSEIALPVSLKAMEMSTPYSCAAVIFLLITLYSLLIAMLMLLLNLCRNSALGVLGAFALNLYGFLLTPEVFKNLLLLPEALSYKANVLCGWLSPLNHATYYMHNFGYDYLPLLGMSIGIFVFLITLSILLVGQKVRNYDFSFVQVDE